MSSESSTNRRRFLGKAAAAVSLPLGVTAGSAAAGATGEAGPVADEREIRLLLQRLATAIADGHSESIDALFSEPSGGDRFACLRRLAPAGFGADDAVRITGSAREARVTVRCEVDESIPIELAGSLGDLVRLQGVAGSRRSIDRVLEADLVKRSDGWKFRRLRLTDA